VLSGALRGEEVDLSTLNEPLKDSVRVLAEDIDGEMSSEIVVPTNLHTTTLMHRSGRTDTLRRCTGKYVKKELLKSVGDTLSEDEEQQYEEDKRELIEMIMECL